MYSAEMSLSLKEYFCTKLLERLDRRPVFVPDTNDEDAFDLEDVMRKLPQPKTVGSSSRYAGQLVFNCYLSEWHLT